tara:strand:+ start:1016 stop:1537 length:522 start_codon:yes stop_codon:yes gene_type:complete
MKHTKQRVTTTVVQREDGSMWYVSGSGYTQSVKSHNAKNDNRMFVDGSYIPQAHPLHKAGRYESFNDAAFSSFSNYDKVPTGDVYIITNKAWPEWIKVGKAVTAKDRLNSYQTSDPFRAYELHCKFTVSNRHSFETQAHQLIKAEASEFKNEWFKINPSKAQRILEVANEQTI